MPGSAVTCEEGSRGPVSFKGRLRSALASADIPTLFMVLVQMTGDRRWLKDPYRPTRNRGLGGNPTGGLDPQVQAGIREAPYQAILAWNGGRPLAVPSPHQLLVDMLAVAIGETVPPDHAELIAHELGLDRTDSQTGEEIVRQRQAPPEGFRASMRRAGGVHFRREPAGHLPPAGPCRLPMSMNDEVEGGRGVVVCTASVAAYEGQIGQVAYAAPKGAWRA